MSASKDEAYYAKLNQILAEQQVRKAGADAQTAQASAFASMPNNSLIMLQLEVDSELDRISHLLSGDIIGTNKEGSTVWLKPSDDRQIIFSEYGVKQIMNLLSFYVNKNTLLSFYDMETIIWKVKDFGIRLSDLIHNRREAFLSYPSPEELFEKYTPIVKKEGYKITEEELYDKCLKWSQEELQSKQSHCASLIFAVIDSVHSTYLRAYQGRERDSLRKQMMVMQSDTLSPQATGGKGGTPYGMK